MARLAVLGSPHVCCHPCPVFLYRFAQWNVSAKLIPLFQTHLKATLVFGLGKEAMTNDAGLGAIKWGGKRRRRRSRRERQLFCLSAVESYYAKKPCRKIIRAVLYSPLTLTNYLCAAVFRQLMFTVLYYKPRPTWLQEISKEECCRVWNGVCHLYTRSYVS